MIRVYFKHLEAQGYSRDTIDSYRQSLRSFGHPLPGTINKLQGLVDDMLTRYKPATVHARVAALSSYFEYCVRQGGMKTNPAKVIRLKVIPDRLPKALDYDKVIDVLDKCAALTGFEGVRNRAIMELGYATGARESDLLNARVNDVDFDKMKMRVIGKGNREAVLMFGRAARDALKEYIEARNNIARPDNDVLFIKVDGKQLATLYNIVKKLSGHGPHVFFRHSAATHMVENGAEITAVSEFLRHKSLNTTRIYTRLTGKRLRRLYDRYHPRA